MKIVLVGRETTARLDFYGCTPKHSKIMHCTGCRTKLSLQSKGCTFIMDVYSTQIQFGLSVSKKRVSINVNLMQNIFLSKLKVHTVV